MGMVWLAMDHVQYTVWRIQHSDLIRNKVWPVARHRCPGCSLFLDRCAICLSCLPSSLSPVAPPTAHEQLPAVHGTLSINPRYASTGARFRSGMPSGRRRCSPPVFGVPAPTSSQPGCATRCIADASRTTVLRWYRVLPRLSWCP